MNELKDRLKRGDVSRIAEMSGMAYETAKKTLIDGTRNNAKVKEVAKKYLDMRDAIKNKN